ncbi:unnamed protein product [Urochloa decumbens]|uniref:Uncharacterized protein n=1 Tax=Urochloa decumbens TaxID=240449 RepID=A0ABC9DHB9_9POAL
MHLLMCPRAMLQGFRKVSPDRWEFAHAVFLAGQRHLLANIRCRRGAAGGGSKAATKTACGTTGSGGRSGKEQLERLRREQEALAREVARLRPQQKEARTQLLDVERRVRGTERCAAAFLARAASGEDPAAGVEAAGGKRRRLNAGAAAAPDFLAFVELAALAVASRPRRLPSRSWPRPRAQAPPPPWTWYGTSCWGRSRWRSTSRWMRSSPPPPWEETGEEVLKLVQQIDCLASPSG